MPIPRFDCPGGPPFAEGCCLEFSPGGPGMEGTASTFAHPWGLSEPSPQLRNQLSIGCPPRMSEQCLHAGDWGRPGRGGVIYMDLEQTLLIDALDSAGGFVSPFRHGFHVSAR